MKTGTTKLIFLFLLFAGSTNAIAEFIDPELYINKNGYLSKDIGDDGKTFFYRLNERATNERISRLEKTIEKLPKHTEVHKVCDLMRGGVKAKLIQERGIAVDVAAVNYGYQNSTIACVIKYMHQNAVGTQLIYSKKGGNGMYMVFITD